MSLFDEPISKIISKKTLSPEWALCKYCRVPFLTSTFDKVCERCTTNIQYQIEFKAKVMIVIIIFVSIIVVMNCLVSSYLSKYTNNLLCTHNKNNYFSSQCHFKHGSKISFLHKIRITILKINFLRICPTVYMKYFFIFT